MRTSGSSHEFANQAGDSLGLSILKTLHRKAVFERRVHVLANLLARSIPSDAYVLDIGCGDGRIGSLVKRCNPDIHIKGIEFAPRPACLIDCEPFDGRTIPFADGSFDVSMFVDVLHHTNEIDKLLSEACRVSRKFVLIKDHLAENRFDFMTLKLMDWVGNRPHGVILPYNYQNRAQWNQYFQSTALNVREWQDCIPLYPAPFSALFGRRLHFIALLGKTNE